MTTVSQLRSDAQSAPKFVIEGMSSLGKVWAGHTAKGLGWTFDREGATEFAVGFDGIDQGGGLVGGMKVDFHKADGRLHGIIAVRGWRVEPCAS